MSSSTTKDRFDNFIRRQHGTMHPASIRVSYDSGRASELVDLPGASVFDMYFTAVLQGVAASGRYANKPEMMAVHAHKIAIEALKLRKGGSE